MFKDKSFKTVRILNKNKADKYSASIFAHGGITTLQNIYSIGQIETSSDIIVGGNIKCDNLFVLDDCNKIMKVNYSILPNNKKFIELDIGSESCKWDKLFVNNIHTTTFNSYNLTVSNNASFGKNHFQKNSLIIKSTDISTNSDSNMLIDIFPNDYILLNTVLFINSQKNANKFITIDPYNDSIIANINKLNIKNTTNNTNIIDITNNNICISALNMKIAYNTIEIPTTSCNNGIFTLSYAACILNYDPNNILEFYEIHPYYNRSTLITLYNIKNNEIVLKYGIHEYILNKKLELYYDLEQQIITIM
jgi:hypothetical protein